MYMHLSIDFTLKSNPWTVTGNPKELTQHPMTPQSFRYTIYIYVYIYIGLEDSTR